jgi:hypothetical protein
MEAHLEAMKGHSGAVDTQPVDVDAHPGTMGARPGAGRGGSPLEL